MQTPPLKAYLANEARAPIIRKGLFAGEYILLGDYMPSALRLYETGAILGYTYRNRIELLISLFCQPGQERDLIAHMSMGISDKIAKLGGEPKDFMELYFIPEATRLIGVLRDAGLTTYSDWLDFPRLAKQKMRTSDVWSQFQFTAAEGIAFGYSHPDLAESLFAYQHDPQAWQEARSHGLEIPGSPPKAKSIHDRQIEAKALIKPYIAKEALINEPEGSKSGSRNWMLRHTFTKQDRARFVKQIGLRSTSQPRRGRKRDGETAGRETTPNLHVPSSTPAHRLSADMPSRQWERFRRCLI